LKRWLPVLIGAGLCLATLATWWPALCNGFINYDDGGYVVQNLHARRGLTWDTVRWAFICTRNGNWHPLTWLSHSLDCQWYGLNPVGHHLTSVLLHVLNTGLLLLVLYRLTGALWRSGFVTALFALHPLRVESVAWVAERKDVLSGLFFFLTLWAYARYAKPPAVRNPKSEVERANLGEAAPVVGIENQQSKIKNPKALNYVLAVFFFALGLLSKPMLVTLPFVLLLLDYWPLERFRHLTLSRLLLEKTPFFVLSALVSVVTLVVQTAGGNTESLPLQFRLSNALVAYARYLGKLMWPQNLAVFYPRPESWPFMSVLGAAALLAGITVLAVWRGRTQRYWRTGWFWFLGMLVPVLGWVAIGEHALADRYTYLPANGLLLALVWGVADLVQGHALARRFVLTAGVLALAACAFTTRSYLKQWANTLTLFEHALQVTRNNHVAYIIAADALRRTPDHNRAGAYCARALLISPASAPAWNLMAVLQADEGKLPEALVCASNGIKARPNWNAEAYFNRATILLELRRNAEAKADFEHAVQMDGEHILSRINLATLLMGEGHLDEAIAQYQVALRLDPNQAAGHYNLANALNRKGRPTEAIEHYQQSLKLDPANAAVHCNLAQVLVHQQLTNDALTHFEAALRLDPALAQAHYGLAVAANQRGDTALALTHLRQALQPNPDFPAALAELAWIRATASDPEVRSGAAAVRAAERACELTAGGDAWCIMTLAAAYAEAGRFGDAVAAAEKGRALALAARQHDVAGRIASLLDAVKAGRAFHQGEAPRK
jgi:tetratricopeptide (TPR) repeat protein